LTKDEWHIRGIQSLLSEGEEFDYRKAIQWLLDYIEDMELPAKQKKRWWQK